MPAVSERQRRFAGAELARKRAGKKTRTGMSEAQLRELAVKPSKGGAHGVIKRRPHGSGPFTDADLTRGYKIHA